MIDQTLDLLLLIEKAKKQAQKIGDVEIAYQLYQIELNVRCGTPAKIEENQAENQANPEEWYPSPGDFASPPV